MEKLKINPFNPVEGMTDEEIIEYLADCLLDECTYVLQVNNEIWYTYSCDLLTGVAMKKQNLRVAAEKAQIEINDQINQFIAKLVNFQKSGNSTP